VQIKKIMAIWIMRGVFHCLPGSFFIYKKKKKKIEIPRGKFRFATPKSP